MRVSVSQITTNMFHLSSVLSSFMTYHRVCKYSNTLGATSGAGTGYLPVHMGSPQVLSGAHDVRSSVFCVVFCRALFVLFIVAIVLFVLRLTDSDYPFGIFKLFFLWSINSYINYIKIH